MKKLTYIFIFLLLVTGTMVKAQTVTGSPISQYGILENKLKKSDKNLTNEKKNTNPKFWLSRAELMMNIFDVNRQFITKGSSTPVQIKLFFQNPKTTKKWQKGSDNYEEYMYDRVNIIFKNGVVDSMHETSKIYDTPLVDAFQDLQKAKQFDVKKKEGKTIKEDYTRLKKMLQTKGVEQYVTKDYKGAYRTFSDMIHIDSLPLMKGSTFDTAICYYTAIAAAQSKMSHVAIKYYNLTKDYNYNQPNLYVFLKQEYLAVGDTAKGLDVLQEGFKRYPQNQSVLIELINYYLSSGEGDRAMSYLRKAQAQDPGNLSFLFAEGTLFDKMGKEDKALETYQKCIDKDPTYFNAYYNIGVMYYNQAVNLYQQSDSIKDAHEYGIIRDSATSVLHKCLPYMEKAHALKPDDIGTMQTLRTLYYRLQENDKYKAIDAELKKAQGGSAKSDTTE